MKIKRKILLSLIMTILMIKPSISASYVQPGYIDSVTVKTEAPTCTLKIKYKSSSDTQLGAWSCDNLAGKAILDLAKIAAILDRPVEVIFTAGTQTVKQVIGITLK
ncbi:hypothetical protein [Bartonella bilalgolemii]|uniref:Uncharacterized protein n=1 Tax=Bartonella bilalgolemii TaxID=2942911 RepID=A0ABT0P9K3_9HYPH|nr:hypothetical protein [Bartonella sp. G70]MCL6229907.1 hypothetical protein [Bartonella sp. G70]